MTPDKTPTDALSKLRHLYANLTNGGVRDTASAKRIADGLLAPAIKALERGVPVVASEPVYAFRRKGLDDFCTCTEQRYAELSAKPNLFETRIFYLTPQPTQAQAGAVPQYRLLQSGVDRIEAADEFLSDGTLTWAADPKGIFVGNIYGGHALRPARRQIKGGQHGADA